MRRLFLPACFAALAAAELAVGPLLTSAGAGPDLLLTLAVWVALIAPREVSPAFYWSLGTFSDLFCVPRPGVRGLGYLLAALAVERVTPGPYRRSPLIAGLLAAAAAVAVEGLYCLAWAAWAWPGGAAAALQTAVRSALMTGLAALLLSWPLARLARLFGWPTGAAPLSRVQMMAAAAAGAARPPRRVAVRR